MTNRSAPGYILRALVEGGASAARLDLSADVKSLSYEDVEKGTDKLVITLNNFDYAYFNSLVIHEGTVLEFSFGYGDGRMSPIRIATITKIGGGTELKVEADGPVMGFNLVQRVRNFRGVKRSDVAAQIAQENGYGPDKQFIEDTKVLLSQVTQARMTDAQLLRDLANREGFQWWIDYNGFHFKKRDVKQEPRREFIYYIDPGDGDIIGPPHVEKDTRAKAGSVKAKGIDPKTKQLINATANNDTTAGRQGLADFVTIDAPTETGIRSRVAQSAILPTTAKSQDEAQRQVDALFQQVQQTALIITFPAVGDPDFEAKTVCKLSGIGGAVSGNCYCTKVKHDLGQNGYTMSVTLRRDGSNHGRTATAAKVNDQAAPTDPAAAANELVPVAVIDEQTGQRVVQWKPRGSVQP